MYVYTMLVLTYLFSYAQSNNFPHFMTLKFIFYYILLSMHCILLLCPLLYFMFQVKANVVYQQPGKWG